VSDASPQEVTVRLDATAADVEVPAAVAQQIPEASTLAAGTKVSVPPQATRQGGVLRRMLGGTHVAVPAWARCTALLVRGYVRIGAAGDAAWGVVPGEEDHAGQSSQQ
jgi:hypothetical protein